MKVLVDVEDLQLLIDGFRSKPYDWDKAEEFVTRTEAQLAELEEEKKKYDAAPWCANCGRAIQWVIDDRGSVWIHARADGKIVDPPSSKWCDGHSDMKATRNPRYT